MARNETQATPNEDQARFWRLPQVARYTGRSRSAIYRDATFPKPIKLGPNTSGWEAESVRKWCDDRVAEASGDRQQVKAA
jgi:prophage regulatory protein